MKNNILKLASAALLVLMLCGVAAGLTSCTDNGGEKETVTEPEMTLPADKLF